MKFFSVRFGLARSLVALAVSFALGISTPLLAFASLAESARSEATRSLPVLTGKSSSRTNTFRADSSSSEIQLTASATATAVGVMLHWNTNSTPDNLGFNVYRLQAGQRTKVNKEIIPGALFAAGTPALMRAGYSYSWFDRGGTADSTYFIESVNVQGNLKIHGTIGVSKAAVPGFEQIPEPLSGTASATESTDRFERSYPVAESQLPHTPNGTIQEQWAIAAQTSLKIGVKKDGWYRVTQEQMVAAGFNPTVDIRNLRLFVDANEVAINTNQSIGPFGAGDYIEFYGQGLDTPVTDTRIYYLLAGTTPGKRVTGDIQLDSPPVDPPGPTGTPLPVGPVITPPITQPGGTTPTAITPTSAGQVLRDPIFYSWVLRDFSVWTDSLSSSSAPVNREPRANDTSRPAAQEQTADASRQEQAAEPDSRRQEQAAGVDDKIADPNPNVVAKAGPVVASTTAVKVETPSASPARATTVRRFQKQRRSKKGKRSQLRRKLRQKHNHAFMGDGFAPTNFDHTIQIKNRGVYLANLQNGDEENWFGNVIASTPVNLTLAATNADLSASGPATLEFAIQGVSSQFANPHAITVSFNGTTIDTLNFGSSERIVRTISIPLAQLQSGNNALIFTKTSTGEVSIVDYVRLTYPHIYKADSVEPCGTPNRVPESLKFNLLGSQSLRMDGFCTPLVRIIDYTDPLNVSLMKPDSEPSAFGYAVTVPRSETFSKEQRLLYAVQQEQFAQPATLVLSEPSNLNLNSNGADFLIISHKTFMGGLEPLRAARAAQGMIARVVDVEDVYDEFSYGLHGPQAIKAFLQYAATNWVTAPRYVIFAGDASLDPRNYTGLGNFDLVPTKLVDATFNETCSDDWFTDFDNDGIADIPVGRLPFRTVTDATIVISKIVNFTPVVPQSAVLVADDPAGYYWDFENSNDEVEILLQPSLTVQKVYRGLALKPLTGTVNTSSTSNTVTGTGTLFTTELQAGSSMLISGHRLGTVASVSNNTTLTLNSNAWLDYSGSYGKQDNPTARADLLAKLNSGKALVNYTGHGNVDVWTGVGIFNAADAGALTNGSNLSFVVVMDCLNGYFLDPQLLSMSEALLKAPNGGAVAAFASSGLTFPDGQHEMAEALYTLLYGSQPIALGDAIKSAKGATLDADVRRTWVFFGDPSMKIR